MKFSQMEYQRPDVDGMIEQYKQITERFPNCKNAKEQMKCILEHESIMKAYQTMSTLAYIHNSINTADEFYAQEKAFYNEKSPVIQEYEQAFLQVVYDSRFKKELEKELGTLFFENIKVALRSFSPEIIPLLQQENELTTEYQKLLASAKIEFDGKELNLSTITTYLQDLDRTVRKEAWKKCAAFFEEHAQKLDEIYDQLVKNRDEQARKLGYANYVQLGYDRLGRNCYRASDVKVFREQIIRDLVPVTVTIRKMQAQRIGVDEIKLHDTGVSFTDGNPKPNGETQELVSAAQKMYDEMSPKTSEFFTFMRENELFDLESKQNKAGGGYCTELPDYQSPFIFSNFNGTSGDVDVLTHEAGHAFAAYQARNMEIRENASTTMETAEVHSMTMELLARPWAELFFGNDAEKFRVFQLESALNFIPYGCLVDEFQHEVYENPKLTPQERKKLWLKLEKKYRPWLDFDNLPFFKDGGGFQKQHHIYCYPFYYIDYCLAQTVALEFWSKSNRDWKKAFDEYFAFVSAAGTKSYVQLIKDSGLNSPFEDGCVKELSTEVVQWMEQHRIK